MKTKLLLVLATLVVAAITAPAALADNNATGSVGSVQVGNTGANPTVDATVAEAAGLVVTPLTCTLPAELLAVLPPPACTVPTEFEAVLFPDPTTDVGAEAAAVALPTVAPTVGLAAVLPTWTDPTEPVALLSASAAGAVIAAARSVASTSINLVFMLPPPFLPARAADVICPHHPRRPRGCARPAQNPSFEGCQDGSPKTGEIPLPMRPRGPRGR